MERLKEIWKREPVLIAAGVIEVAIVVMSALGEGLSVEAAILAGLVAVSSWMVRNHVYSPHTGQRIEYLLTVYQEIAESRGRKLADKHTEVVLSTQERDNLAEELEAERALSTRLDEQVEKLVDRLAAVDPEGLKQITG